MDKNRNIKQDKTEEDIKYYVTEWLRRSQEKLEDGAANQEESN